MRTIVLRMTRDPGSMLSLSAVSGQLHHDVTVRATRDGSVVRIPEDVLKNLCAGNPEWGCQLGKRVLGAMSRELRSARAHLVSEAFDGELLAVESILEQIRTELPVASKLHKIPHLLKATVTMADALTIIDQARASEDHLSSHTANLCHELLAPVRRENRFFSGLAAAYEEVVRAPITESPASLRKKCAANFIRVFSEVPSEVRGLENLPNNSGNIFLFNHLKNHEHNTLPNGFQLTLDSHFISSMILHKKYGDPGVRVVRQSRASEYGHQDYYERLGHISVYTPDSDTPSDDRSERFLAFIEAASAHLARGQNLVLAPEGTSYPTEKSPGPFKAGAFRLAGALSPEPYLVPIAMANFDRRLAHARLAAVIHPPFRMSEYVSDVNDPAELSDFLETFRAKYARWVKEASAIAELG